MVEGCGFEISQGGSRLSDEGMNAVQIVCSTRPKTKKQLILVFSWILGSLVHVPPGLQSFLEDRDRPRRVAIDAALEAQTFTKKGERSPTLWARLAAASVPWH